MTRHNWSLPSSLALKYHPDKNHGNHKENTKKFLDISEAYEILGKTLPPATPEPTPETEHENAEDQKSTENTESNASNSHRAQQFAGYAAQHPRPSESKSNSAYTNNTQSNAWDAYKARQSAWHAAMPKFTNNARPNILNPYYWHFAWNAQQRRRTASQNSRTPKEGHAGSYNANPPHHQPKSQSPRRRGFDITGRNDESAAPSSGGYSYQYSVPPTGAEETAPAEKSTSFGETTATEETTRAGKPAEKSQERRRFDPTGRDDEPMAPSCRDYSKQNFVSPTGAGETTSAEVPAPTEKPASTEKPAPTEKPPWLFFGKYELDSQSTSHTEKPHASEGQQPLTRPLLWILEGRPLRDNKGKRFSARDSKRQLGRTPAAKSRRRHVQTPECDEFTCRVTYCTTDSGIRRRVGKLQYPPAIDDLIARFERFS